MIKKKDIFLKKLHNIPVGGILKGDSSNYEF